MVRYTVIVLTLLFCLSVNAQDKVVFPKWRLGVSPAAMLYEFEGIQVSLDRRLNENINLATEYARVLPSFQNKGGYRLHAGPEVILLRGRLVSYICGVHFTHIATLGQREIKTRARNREFSYVSYQDVQNDFNAISISNTFLLKLGKRWYITLGGGVGSGRKSFSAPWKDSKITTTSGLYYIDFNFSYAIGL